MTWLLGICVYLIATGACSIWMTKNVRPPVQRLAFFTTALLWPFLLIALFFKWVGRVI